MKKYHERWERIPMEELEASSVQHPLHSEMRWLLHTRRVPLREQEATDQTKQDFRQPCAGIGDLTKDSWLCKDCVLALCVKKPKMPPLALANDLWGGRLHPLYHNLNLATIAALSPGRAMMN